MSDAKIDSLERLQAMTQAEVDDLPYGFIVLDAEGRILLYNRYEARMARLPPERVVGRNFFRDVAPCTRVEAFHGRFRALADDPSRVTDRFGFRFHFLHGAQDVTIELARVPEGSSVPGSALDGARVFMMVQRRSVSVVEGSLPSRLVLDPDRGCAEGPLGAVLPLPAEALVAVLERLGPQGARELGRSLGASLAVAAGRAAESVGEPDVNLAPWQLAAGILDDVMAGAGLGRVALDQSARIDANVLGCLVRPAVELPSRLLAQVYEGLLEAALRAAVGRDLTARCFDDGSLLAQPWRFAVVPEPDANQLAPRDGERADDVARRLGLLVDEAF